MVYRSGVENKRGELTYVVCNLEFRPRRGTYVVGPLKNGMSTRSCEAIADPFGDLKRGRAGHAELLVVGRQRHEAVSWRRLLL